VKYLMDTDWIINWLKGKAAVVEKIKGFREAGIGISIVSVCEIYDGIYGSDHPDKNEERFNYFLTGVTVVELTERICRKFGQLRNDLRKRGKPKSEFDLLIATTALINDLELLTDNVKHYERIDGLKIGPSSGRYKTTEA